MWHAESMMSASLILLCSGLQIPPGRMIFVFSLFLLLFYCSISLLWLSKGNYTDKQKTTRAMEDAQAAGRKDGWEYESGEKLTWVRSFLQFQRWFFWFITIVQNSARCYSSKSSSTCAALPQTVIEWVLLIMLECGGVGSSALLLLLLMGVDWFFHYFWHHPDNTESQRHWWPCWWESCIKH